MRTWLAVVLLALVPKLASAEVEAKATAGSEVGASASEEDVVERIVLDEYVLFDADRARVKRHAKRALHRVLFDWESHPEWDRVVVEAYADDGGTGRYNAWLARERAARVRRFLIDAGAPADKIDVVARGRVDRGHDESECAQNRRVELVILRRPAE
jgi:outer membrane protein OmpA-like peptidoglycan-associated protein